MEFIRSIDKTWTLFLDRDGVINRRPIDDYVKSWEEFEFLPGVITALKSFSKIFCRIIVVTNQQGIGKGIMSVDALELIHRNMISEIEKHGGRIDAVYFCPDIKGKDGNCRKPNTAMAELAKRDFPEIILNKSIMAGDMPSDMLFGKNAQMKTVYINSRMVPLTTEQSDAVFSSLFEFSKKISTID